MVGREHFSMNVNGDFCFFFASSQSSHMPVAIFRPRFCRPFQSLVG